MLLGLDHVPEADATDTLAVAPYHGLTRETLTRITGERIRQGGQRR